MFAKQLGIALLMPLTLFAMPVHAYIGPGAGAGTIAVVLGILASIVMAFFAILWYPIKRFVKKRKSVKNAGQIVSNEASNNQEEK